MACALAMALILGGCGEKAAHDEHGHDHDMHHEEEEAHAHGHEAHGARSYLRSRMPKLSACKPGLCNRVFSRK